MTQNDPGNPIDRLEQEARVERFPRMGSQPADTQAILVARENIIRWMKERGVSNLDLANAAGVAPSTLAQVLRGVYVGTTENILRKVEAAVSTYCDQQSKPTGGRFVMTRVAREIFAVVRVANRHQGIGVVTGPSGCGKSMALEGAVRMDFRNALLVEVNAGCSTPLAFLQALQQAERSSASRVKAKWTRSSGFGCGNVADSFNAVVERLAGSGRLILVDEADGLKNDTLNIIRQLHDACRCPVVLVGRPHLHSRISRTMRDPSIGGSLVGRICVEHSLNAEAGAGGDRGGRWLFSVDEVVTMLEQYKVTFSPDAARWLCVLANVSAVDGQREGGGLRFAMQVWDMALTLNPGAQITVAQLKQAHTLLRGAEFSQRVDQVIQEFDRTARVAG